MVRKVTMTLDCKLLISWLPLPPAACRAVARKITIAAFESVAVAFFDELATAPKEDVVHLLCHVKDGDIRLARESGVCR
jgi:hypothetical protein